MFSNLHLISSKNYHSGSSIQKQPPRGGLKKRCSEKFTGEQPCRSAINITSAWVFSGKLAAYVQDTFSQEHLWMAASVHV